MLLRFAFLLTLCCMALDASAQEPGAPAKSPIVLAKEWDAALARAEKLLGRPDITDERLDELQIQLSALRQDLRTQADLSAPVIKTARSELEALGPPPAESAAPEAANIADRRKSINENIASAEGVVKEAELAGSRTDRLLDRVSALKRLRFTERIMTRGPSPLSPAIWRQSAQEIASYGRSLRDAFTAWSGSDQTAAEIREVGWQLPAGLIVTVLLVWPFRLWLTRRYGYVAVEGEPTYRQRLQTALFTGFVRPLIPTAAALAAYLSLRYMDLWSESADAIAFSILVALIGNFFVVAFCWAALAPNAPSWRLAPISDHAALVISRTVTALAAVFGLDWILDEVNNQVSASTELVTLQEFLSGLAISGLLFALLRRHIWQRTDHPGRSRVNGLRMLRLPLSILVCAIPLSACLGYVALSRVMATQLVQSAGLFVFLVLLRGLGDEAIEQALKQKPSWSLRLKHPLFLTEEGSGILAFWLKVALRFAILLAGVLTLPLLWGAGGNDIQAWLREVFFGIQIGPVKVSLANLLWAIALFAAVLLVTRLLQRTLQQQIFPRTHLDTGLRHSIRSAIGYTGFILAAMLAVASLGLDLSNLALIAGALSVGIGLGLQNIVNNFVSGIILLIERPFKVGDWIVVGSQQGYVTKISVRATEISTFDRASVFVPNSELIASSVVNRTYADPQGRVVIPVGIAYGSDTQCVRRTLMEQATAHPDVLDNPPPMVLFRAFGDSALQFEVVAYIGDVNRSLLVTSDLCFAIDEAFARENIQFPYPHRDVQMTFGDEQWERLVTALNQDAPAEHPPRPAATAERSKTPGPK